MGVLKPISPSLAPMIEWRAGRIEDPVERLRFLQSTAHLLSRPLISSRRLRAWKIRALAPVGLWICMLIPAPTPMNVSSPSLQASMVSIPEEETGIPAVWLIENNRDFEIYSNGLRIEKEFATANRPRQSFEVFPAGDGAPVERSTPAGIVFHSTESHQAPFEPGQTRTLTRLGRNLVEYVRQKKAYHYVIDRFGRVWRVVNETDAAFHAGNSIWGDKSGSYVFLNDSFLGVALEAQTDTPEALSSAQVHSVRVLTEMLRARYHLPSANCVTHSQVSVNPSNWRVGYHTDWVTGFPFKEAGLPDNYRLSLASLTAFGFEADEAFSLAMGSRPWPGLLASLQQVSEQARVAGVPAAEHRRRLHQKFQAIVNSASNRERGEEQ